MDFLKREKKKGREKKERETAITLPRMDGWMVAVVVVFRSCPSVVWTPALAPHSQKASQASGLIDPLSFFLFFLSKKNLIFSNARPEEIHGALLCAFSALAKYE